MNGPLKRTAQEWWAQQQRHLSDVARTLSIALQETNELVGICGLFDAAQYGEWETWLQLRSRFWGQGIGSEVTSALLDVAFRSLGASHVIGVVDPMNQASLNMIKRLGFAFQREYAGGYQWQQGHHVYAVTPATFVPAMHVGQRV
jgi:RimJ/RimL family protein N-acetyltransferase